MKLSVLIVLTGVVLLTFQPTGSAFEASDYEGPSHMVLADQLPTGVSVVETHWLDPSGLTGVAFHLPVNATDVTLVYSDKPARDRYWPAHEVADVHPAGPGSNSINVNLSRIPIEPSEPLVRISVAWTYDGDSVPLFFEDGWGPGQLFIRPLWNHTVALGGIDAGLLIKGASERGRTLMTPIIEPESWPSSNVTLSFVAQESTTPQPRPLSFILTGAGALAIGFLGGKRSHTG